MSRIMMVAAALAAATAVSAQAQTAPTQGAQLQGGPRQGAHRGPGLFRGTLAADGGSMTQAELDAALQARMQAHGRAMGPRAEERANRLFAMADTNHDGRVTAAEFQAARPEIRAQRMRWREERQARMAARQSGGATAAH